MEQLTKSEEKIMQIIWKLRKAFVKDIIAQMENTESHYNTISTIVRILEKKGFLAHKAYGKTYEYYPIISQKIYKRYVFRQLVSDYFDHSYQNLVSFMVKEEEITDVELEKIKKILDND